MPRPSTRPWSARPRQSRATPASQAATRAGRARRPTTGAAAGLNEVVDQPHPGQVDIRAAAYDSWQPFSATAASAVVGAEFRPSWTATVGQLKNLGLLDGSQRAALAADEPRFGDYKRLGLSWNDELAAPYVSPGFASACLNGFVAGRLTSSRCLELLRGTVTEPDLPRQEPVTLNDLRASFTTHAR